jgi:glycerol-3-phosphate dehydrogenase
VEARFIVNAAGPWVARVDSLTEGAPPARPLRLVRGSHIVLPMPKPAQTDAYTLQDEEERVIFVIPWLEGRFLIVGTTDVAHEGNPGEARCSEAEKTYLLAAHNRYFAGPRPAAPTDVVFTWSGVRALHDDVGARPSRISRGPELSSVANGTGGFVSLYGGKLTTHRAVAEEVLETLQKLGAAMSGAWTRDVPLYGGTLTKPELLAIAERGPASVAAATRRRLALTYGDKIETLFEGIATTPALAEEIAPGVTRAELDHAREIEDAMTAEDFLLRRTKLYLTLNPSGLDAVRQWFSG